MTTESTHDRWSAGENYERYMGRWSRAVAGKFLDWLHLPGGLDWLDVGCGTGALTATILERCSPRTVVGVDPSEGFAAHARDVIGDLRARFEVGGASSLPLSAASADAVVSALAYNFFPNRPLALSEMRRVARAGATIGFYVWDYPGGGMAFMRAFWQAAVALNPSAQSLVESARFPFCEEAQLSAEAESAGVVDVETTALEIQTEFANFDDFWVPFTLGTGPAPGYCASLVPGARDALRSELVRRLGETGPLRFGARAWAVRGRAP